MTKLIFVCILFITVISFTSCSLNSAINSDAGMKSQTSSAIPSVQIESDVLFTPQTVAELEEAGQYIVQGTLLNDAEQKTKTYKNEAKPYFGITVSSFKIDKVYKGDLKEGDIIKLGEKYFTYDYNNKKTIYHFGNYMPSEVGKEYLFFLVDESKSGDWWSGIYSPVSWERGRYPVSEQTFGVMKEKSVDSMSNEELNLGQDDSSEYKALFEQVKEKYMK